jgi:hypothetical protein
MRVMACFVVAMATISAAEPGGELSPNSLRSTVDRSSE